MVLFVEDEPDILELYQMMFQEAQVPFQLADRAHRAQELIAAGGIQLIICDAHLPDLSGADLFQWLRQQGHSIPFYLITGDPDTAEVESVKEQVSGIIPKPCDFQELLQTMRRHLK